MLSMLSCSDKILENETYDLKAIDSTQPRVVIIKTISHFTFRPVALHSILSNRHLYILDMKKGARCQYFCKKAENFWRKGNETIISGKSVKYFFIVRSIQQFHPERTLTGNRISLNCNRTRDRYVARLNDFYVRSFDCFPILL